MGQEPGCAQPLRGNTPHKLFLLVGNVEATKRFLASSQPKLLLCSVELVYCASALTQGGQHFLRVGFKCFSLHSEGPS